MYRRFLNNNDYLGIITEEALKQLIRGNTERISQAEEAAEASVLEYLTDNYEIEQTLEVGKSLLEYNPQIIYPVGAHFYYNGKIVEALRSIAGYKAPSSVEYWKELEEYDEERYKLAVPYRQIHNYKPGDLVTFADTYYECLEYNGIDYNDIRVPGIVGWATIETTQWLANKEYEPWDVVEWEGKFFALLNTDNIDMTVNPFESDNWGLIGTYDPTFNYQFNDTEFVEYNGQVFIPVMTPTCDALKEGYNFRYHDPRNPNIKKHLVRLALYELHKLISPNNVSSARIADFEASIMWLRDANRCKINPQIPRKLDEESKPVSEIVVSTYMRDYDPYKNPWQI